MRTKGRPGADRIYHIKDTEVTAENTNKYGERIADTKVMMTCYWFFTRLLVDQPDGGSKRKARRFHCCVMQDSYLRMIKKLEKELEENDE